MASVNKVILIGNLGKDPEIKYTPGGTPIARFSLATNERTKDKDGNWVDRTEWHNIVAFQRTAEVAAEYLKKGRSVYVEGRIHTDTWDDKETGQKRYKTEIYVNNLVMLGSREGAESAGYTGRSPAGKSASDQLAQPEAVPAVATGAEITDEDIPF